MPVIYKSDDMIDMDMLIKAAPAFDDKGELLAVVYAPELRDSQGDIASASVIKDMAYEAAQKGLPQIDIRHDGKALDRSKAYVAESFIVQKGDSRFEGFKDYDGKAVDVAGGWATVIKIEDPELRKAFKNGEWNGVSMAGHAAVETEKSDEMVERILKSLVTRITTSKDGDIPMDEKALKTLLAESNAELVKEIAKAVGEALKPAEPDKKDDKVQKTEAPKFSGEATVENLRKHRIAVAKHKIISETDFNDAESVKKSEEALAALEKDGAEGKKEDNPEIAKLEKQLADLRKSSNQSSADSKDANLSEIEKEDKACAEAAAAMVKHANASRGYESSK